MLTSNYVICVFKPLTSCTLYIFRCEEEDAKYSFEYRVKDEYSGQDFGQEESRFRFLNIFKSFHIINDILISFYILFHCKL